MFFIKLLNKAACLCSEKHSRRLITFFFFFKLQQPHFSTEATVKERLVQIHMKNSVCSKTFLGAKIKLILNKSWLFSCWFQGHVRDPAQLFLQMQKQSLCICRDPAEGSDWWGFRARPPRPPHSAFPCEGSLCLKTPLYITFGFLMKTKFLLRLDAVEQVSADVSATAVVISSHKSPRLYQNQWSSLESDHWWLL